MSSAHATVSSRWSGFTADDALESFRADPGYRDLLDTLDGNPLPDTLVVRPSASMSPDALERLRSELDGRDGIDQVRLDTAWISRLNAILDLARRSIWLIGGLLLIAVVVIVGNTIRLDIQNQRAEIEVSKLLGATDAFVRRPFLYLGFWYGLAGGLLALLILLAAVLVLSGPVQRLVALYGSRLRAAGRGRQHDAGGTRRVVWPPVWQAPGPRWPGILLQYSQKCKRLNP